MARSDSRYSQVYSNKTPNIGVFLPKTGISFTETVPYSFSKVFPAFQSGSRCNQMSSIQWHVRIFDISKCIPIKPQILGVFLPKTEISFTETVPYSFRKVFQPFWPGSRCNQTSCSIRWHVRIFDTPKCIPIKPQILGFFYRKQGFPLLKPSHIRSERCSKRSSPVPDVTRRALSDGMFGFSIFSSVQGVTKS